MSGAGAVTVLSFLWPPPPHHPTYTLHGVKPSNWQGLRQNWGMLIGSVTASTTYELKLVTCGAVRRGPGAVVFGKMVLQGEETGVMAVFCINLQQTHRSRHQPRPQIQKECPSTDSYKDGCGYANIWISKLIFTFLHFFFRNLNGTSMFLQWCKMSGLYWEDCMSDPCWCHSCTWLEVQVGRMALHPPLLFNAILAISDVCWLK